MHKFYLFFSLTVCAVRTAKALPSGRAGPDSVFPDRDQHADLAACRAQAAIVPADEGVLLTVHLRKGGGIVGALIPQIHLHLIGSFVLFVSAHDRGRTHLVNDHGQQLRHGLDLIQP